MGLEDRTVTNKRQVPFGRQTGVTIQIFISYSRDDDLPPPARDDLKGFVTYLDEQLRYELTMLGEPRPKLWRDKRGIEPADQFAELIAKAIEESQLLVVMLSRNWLARAWCRRELELFRAVWSTEEEARCRIVVAARNQVAPHQIPVLLQGQEGYRFFDLDPEGEAGQEHEFFARGQTRDPRYEKRVKELAVYLWRAAKRLEVSPARAESVSADPPHSRGSVSPKGRKVYLAKPAGDMLLAYDRLFRELSGAGYSVLPALETDIPTDRRALTFLDSALAASELSIHMIGERVGHAPEDAEPIVRFQLSRAAERTAVGDGFRRILWAPRFLNEGGNTFTERDPLALVARLDRQLENDTVVGDTLSAFVEFLILHLKRTAPPAMWRPDAMAEGAEVYVYHRPEDEEYAVKIAVALHQRKLRPVLPAVDGDLAELDHFHRETLRECQAVVLCWARASEVWARATCREWRSWERLGRREKFAVRGLVAGPPPSDRKRVLLKLPPENDVDVILDLTTLDSPAPEDLAPLVRSQLMRPYEP
jgi:hypothetical protein